MDLDDMVGCLYLRIIAYIAVFHKRKFAEVKEFCPATLM
jgi:hypothetical protein